MMPRPTLPPTPASSTDLPGKDAPPLSSGLEQSFALPPPALAPRPDMDAGRMPTRRRAPAARSTATLPPPPTRSRKIIHMRPQPALTSAEEGLSAALKPARGPAPAAVDGNGKRKEPTATSAAGRRIARKTAHSLIERRRRSKMNEEFGVLKQMIPACRGHEMHKLAILQASIEYLRYLEQCLADLEPTSQPRRSPGHAVRDWPVPLEALSAREDDDEMDETPLPTPRMGPHRDGGRGGSQPLSVSSGLESETADSPPTRSSIAPLVFPAHSSSGSSRSPLISPCTQPQLAKDRHVDHEATEALLLLNTDRRSHGGRGMSVRDLLTT